LSCSQAVLPALLTQLATGATAFNTLPIGGLQQRGSVDTASKSNLKLPFGGLPLRSRPGSERSPIMLEPASTTLMGAAILAKKMSSFDKGGMSCIGSKSQPWASFLVGLYGVGLGEAKDRTVHSVSSSMPGVVQSTKTLVRNGARSVAEMKAFEDEHAEEVVLIDDLANDGMETALDSIDSALRLTNSVGAQLSGKSALWHSKWDLVAHKAQAAHSLVDCATDAMHNVLPAVPAHAALAAAPLLMFYLYKQSKDRGDSKGA